MVAQLIALLAATLPPLSPPPPSLPPTPVDSAFTMAGAQRDVHLLSGNASLFVSVGNDDQHGRRCMKVEEDGVWVGGGLKVDAPDEVGTNPELLLRVDGQTRWCR